MSVDSELSFLNMTIGANTQRYTGIDRKINVLGCLIQDYLYHQKNKKQKITSHDEVWLSMLQYNHKMDTYPDSEKE